MFILSGSPTCRKKSQETLQPAIPYLCRMSRQIMHMDLDSFFVSVERLLNPDLLGKPVIVGGNSERGVVASCSYEARAFGVRSAMPVRQAKALCPQAIVVGGQHDRYSYYSAIVTEIISGNVPLFEKSSIDEFYVDMSGTDKFFGAYKLATELRQKIMRETSLPISFALSTSKTVSKIGTGQAKPNGQMEIPAGTEKTFLAPLPIQKIPMLGKKATEILNKAGIHTIGQLQKMNAGGVKKLLGEHGINLWEKANGICHSAIEPYSERKSVSTETTFETDVTDTEYLKRILLDMCEKLGFQLRSEQQLSGCVAVKIRYSNFETSSMQSVIPYTAVDQVLFEKIKFLFDRLYEKGRPVRLVGARLSHLTEGNYQFDMFSDTGEQMQLANAVDKLKMKFGSDILMKARSLDLNKRDGNLFDKKG